MIEKNEPEEEFVCLDHALKAISTHELEEAIAMAVHQLTGANVRASVSSLEYGFVHGTKFSLTLHQQFDRTFS